MVATQPDLSSWLEKIEAMHPNKIDLGLERIAKVATRLACTEFSCPVITVAGTNGKGSCAKTLQAIAQAADFRTGLYTSPHFIHFNERIQIAGNDIDDANLCLAFEAVEAACEADYLTYFEFTTLAALWLFQRADCELVILEVGLGGRLDAVNIVDSDISIITSIAYDHQDYLGDDLAGIAHEKAGIMRSGKPVIIADRNTYALLAPLAKTKRAHIIARGFQYEFHHAPDERWCWSMLGVGSVNDLQRPSFPIANAAAAISALKQLDSDSFDEQAILTGLAKVQVRGRCEVINNQPLTVIDCAHNPHACQWLSKYLKSFPQIARWHAIFGCMQDKDYAEMMRQLQPLMSSWQFVPLNDQRAATPSQLTDCGHQLGIKHMSQAPSVSYAMQQVQQSLKPNEGLVIFGSFFTLAQLPEAAFVL